MKTLGRLISIIAVIVFRNYRKTFERILKNAYLEYCSSLRPKLPNILIETLIVGEDRRFYLHEGIDPIGIMRAIWNIILLRDLQGGSTIEQQLVRTITGRREKRIMRKVREILLSSLISKVIPKSDIPGVYLSIAYFGWKMNGIKQSCNRLGFDLKNITINQAASLIARLKYPEPEISSEQTKCQIIIREHHLINLVLKNRYNLICDQKRSNLKWSYFQFLKNLIG
jgi:membrane peptidoglycan carboxypeptidase